MNLKKQEEKETVNTTESNSIGFNQSKRLEQNKLSSDKNKTSIDRESVSDSGVDQAKKSSCEIKKRASLKSLNKTNEPDSDANSVGSNDMKIPRKFITTWKMACDKTKDRTKELLKRWRTLPEDSVDTPQNSTPNAEHLEHNWSVHVWTTWVKRDSTEDENLLLQTSETSSVVNNLSQVQKEKLSHLFSYLLDMDRDDFICKQDFEAFTERLRHFTDWSNNCDEYLVLLQVQEGFMQEFLQPPLSEAEHPSQVDIDKHYLSLEQWLQRWSSLITGTHNLEDFPVWLQYFPKVMFHAINRSGSGRISRNELSAFFSSVLGYSNQKVEECLDDVFNIMTANGDHPIKYNVYRLCFANFLLGRHPNGPGQYMFGSVGRKLDYFPVDYSALNSVAEEIEHYSPGKKSNRVSVIV